MHNNAVAEENIDIGHFTFMINFNVFLLDLENSDIEAVSFEGSKTKQIN